MTYVNLSSPVPGRNMFIADVTLDGSETGTLVIPHGINTVPLMAWAQMMVCEDGISTSFGAIPIAFPYYLTTGAVNVEIRSNTTVGFTFLACTFRIYVARPQSAFL